MASRPDPRRDRALLGAALAAAFALSALTDPLLLSGALAAAVAVFRRGSLRVARRLLVSVVPVAGGLSLASWAWLRVASAEPVAVAPFVSLALRAVVVGFLTLSTLARVDLLRALAPYPTATRLLVVTLAQIHALRLLTTESLDGLRSRLPRRPRTLDVLRGAGGITGALFTIQARHAREISDAMRSRGF